ncbi:MAG: hypothetical protein PHE99_06820 [Bacteroidales bacterium]|nr:hypothetical protein [Bacteroidales bacterium]
MNNSNNRNQHNASDTNQLGVDNIRLGLESMIKNCSVERIVAYLYFVVQKYNVTIAQLAQFKEPAEAFKALRCLGITTTFLTVSDNQSL